MKIILEGFQVEYPEESGLFIAVFRKQVDQISQN